MGERQTSADKVDLTHLSYAMRKVCWEAYDGRLEEGARQALLDALNAVPRSASWQHVDCEECGGTCGNAAAYYEERWGEAEARAERAEAELYRLRTCVAAQECWCGDGSQCPSCYARAALAGQDADAGEPWDKAKLLDALDAVPRMLAEAQELDAYDEQAVHDNRQIAKLRDRAERMERERDAAQLAAALLYGAHQQVRMDSSEGEDIRRDVLRAATETCPDVARQAAALSADADADAESEPDCKDHKHSQSDGRTYQCPKCGRYTFPPTPRAEGDDGRSRAIEAATRCGTDGLCRGDAEEAIDAALAEGGVLDVMAHKRALEAEAAKTDEWKARVRELEAALREIATGDVLPHGAGYSAALKHRARAALGGVDRA